MKRKMIVALIAALTLTMGTVGTVMATSESNVAAAENLEERPGYIWVVDKEAVYETIHHEAEYKTVHHEAEYETVHHEAVTETIEHPEESHIEYKEHPEEFHYEQKLIYQCNGCKEKFESYDEVRAHNKEQMLAGNFACGGHSSFMDDVKVVDKEAWTEEVKIVDKEAWTETVIVKEAWDEQVLVKEAWDEQVLVSPEEGHWEKVETEEPVDPDQPDAPEEPTTPDQPDTPDNPVDPEIPADPDNGETDTEVTETEKPDGAETTVITDTEAAGTNNAPAAEQGNKNTRSGGLEATGNESSGGSSSTVPKTGDPAALGSLITLAGGALASGSAVVWKVKRKK